MLYDWDFYAKQRIYPHQDYASLTWIEVYPDGTFAIADDTSDLPTPLGTVLVIEPDRRNALYKMAGGHKMLGATPCVTALDEMTGETGLRAPPEALTFIDADWRRGSEGMHWSVLFSVRIEFSEVPWANSSHPKNEGEIPKFFMPDEFVQLRHQGMILPYHERRLVGAGLIPV